MVTLKTDSFSVTWILFMGRPKLAGTMSGFLTGFWINLFFNCCLMSNRDSFGILEPSLWILRFLGDSF